MLCSCRSGHKWNSQKNCWRLTSSIIISPLWRYISAHMLHLPVPTLMIQSYFFKLMPLVQKQLNPQDKNNSKKKKVKVKECKLSKIILSVIAVEAADLISWWCAILQFLTETIIIMWHFLHTKERPVFPMVLWGL